MGLGMFSRSLWNRPEKENYFHIVQVVLNSFLNVVLPALDQSSGKSYDSFNSFQTTSPLIFLPILLSCFS